MTASSIHGEDAKSPPTSPKEKTVNIFEENYRSKDIFQSNFFNLINKIVLDKPDNIELNLYVPQKEVLYVLNSYITFEDLRLKSRLKNIYTELKFLGETGSKEDNVFNVLLLDYSNVPDSLNYKLIQDLKGKWELVSDVIIFGDCVDLSNDEEHSFQQMKVQAIKNIYKIPFFVTLNIEFVLLPMWRISDSAFAIDFKQHEHNSLRPINGDNSAVLKNLRKWMQVNQIRYINKVLACERSDTFANNPSTALKLMEMIENELPYSHTDDGLLFDIKKDCNIFIFDRSCDIITPLLTELTYIGLLNEKDFPFLKDIISKENNNGRDVGDNIFENIKFLNFGEVGSVLQRLLSSYGKATNTKTHGDIKAGNNENITSEELSRMIKILSNKEVISNSKNLPKHVNEASDIMATIKDINYNLDDLIEIESLLLSEWNQQSQYLNSSSKLNFNWNKLSSNSSSRSKIIDDDFIINWIEEQNLLGSYDFSKLVKIVLLFNLLYGSFKKKNDFYDKLLVSFSDRFGSAAVAPVFEELFNDHLLIINDSSNSNEKTLANQQLQVSTMEKNKKMLKLLDYMNYIPHTSNESMLTNAINETIAKTANVVNFAFLNPLGSSEPARPANDANATKTDPLSFAYCGITPIITRFLQYSLTINPVTPSLLTLGIPPDLMENVSKTNARSSKSPVSSLNETTAPPLSLLRVKEAQLLKSKIGQNNQKNQTVFSKNVVVITGGMTLSEIATIDKLNKLISSFFKKENESADETAFSYSPITVIVDKVI